MIFIIQRATPSGLWISFSVYLLYTPRRHVITNTYPWLSLVIIGYPWLSLVILGYCWLSLVILGKFLQDKAELLDLWWWKASFGYGLPGYTTRLQKQEWAKNIWFHIFALYFCKYWTNFIRDNFETCKKMCIISNHKIHCSCMGRYLLKCSFFALPMHEQWILWLLIMHIFLHVSKLSRIKLVQYLQKYSAKIWNHIFLAHSCFCNRVVYPGSP